MKVTQLSTFVENRPGRLHSACQALADGGVNIHTLSLADTAEFGILRLIVDDWRTGKAVLEKAGHLVNLVDVLGVEVPDEAGGLARILAVADAAALNIEYMYAFSAGASARAVVIIRFADPDRALAALQQQGINVVDNVALFRA